MQMTWDEMVKKYPDSWLIIANVELGNEGIKSGVVLASCKDANLDELNEMLAKYNGAGDCIWARTTWVTESSACFEFD